MTRFRLLPLAIALAATGALVGCNTAPTMMPMGAAHAGGMATPDHMAKMDAQMKTMHEKMMNAKTPEARSQLMAEHMKTMQDGMAMMDRMPAAPAR